MKKKKRVENPSKDMVGVIKMDSFHELFKKKKGGKEIAAEDKKEVKRVRGKLSKEEVEKYTKSNHNVFDWLCKGREEKKEKDTFEEIESNEIAMEVEEEDLIREGRLQRVEKRKREYVSRRLIQDIMEDVVKDVEEYRLKEIATNLLEEVMELAMEMSDINGMVRLVTEYGPETRNKLENELRRQRMEEMEASRMILKEGERELRLEYVETKKIAWKREYYYMQDNILIRTMKT